MYLLTFPEAPKYGYRFIFVWSGLVCPGLVARSRWPGPGGPAFLPCGFGGPVARSRLLSRPWSALVAVAWFRSRSRSRSWSRSRSRSLPLPGPGGRVPVPIKQITYAVWPASSNLFQEYGVFQTTGERQTILRSRNHYRTKTGAKRLPKPTA